VLPSVEDMSIYPTFRYRDARAAIRFLVDAFGFVEKAVHDNPDGTVGHAELSFGGGVIMLGQRRAESSPFDTERSSTYVVVDDPDAHHAKAVAAGAEIVTGPIDQPYGSREYVARDPDGNTWSFGTYRP
jgi:uncharacterized glyoxalase superfamily protein PhnB